MNKFEYMNDIKTDFSKYEQIDITQEEKENMKNALKKRIVKKNRIKTAVVLAAVVAVVSQAAFADDIFRVIKTISTGTNKFVQIETPQNQPKSVPVPEPLKGQIYNENGEIINELDTSDETKIYNKDGKEVRIGAKVEPDKETEYSLIVVPAVDEIPSDDDTYKIYTDIEDIKKDLNFAPFVPEKLPEGYKFLYGNTFKDEKGNVGGDYVFIYYTNGKNKLTFSERVANEDTAFETGITRDFKEFDIRGNKAVFDIDMLSWEENGVSISILNGKDLTEDDFIELANSTKQ